jgi:hypothetical protein
MELMVMLGIQERDEVGHILELVELIQNLWQYTHICVQVLSFFLEFVYL